MKSLWFYESLKSRYFLEVDAKEATDCINSSYIWGSLMAGKKVVDSGTYFKVGNGLMINVAYDPWIPALPNFVICGPIDSIFYGLKV